METIQIINWLYDKAARAHDLSHTRMLNLAADRMKELDSKQNWIPVTERLPEDTLHRFSEVKQIKVLTALKSDKGVWTVRSQMRYKDSFMKEERWRWKYSGSEITHWMPLPKPPKEGER